MGPVRKVLLLRPLRLYGGGSLGDPGSREGIPPLFIYFGMISSGKTEEISQRNAEGKNQRRDISN